MPLASTQSHRKPFLDWGGWDSRRSPQFFARAGRLVVKVWPQRYRGRFFRARFGKGVWFLVDVGRLEVEVWRR